MTALPWSVTAGFSLFASYKGALSNRRHATCTDYHISWLTKGIDILLAYLIDWILPPFFKKLTLVLPLTPYSHLMREVAPYLTLPQMHDVALYYASLTP